MGVQDDGTAGEMGRLPVGAACRSELETLVAAPPVAPLMVLAGPGSRVAGLAVARALVRDPDVVRVAEPEQGRWTVAEVGELLVGPVSFEPHHRHVLVVAGASSMGSLLWDRLLKLFEEPPSPCWFLLAVDTVDDVPPAVRGRAGATVVCTPADDEVRVAALVEAGVAPGRAAALVSAAGGQLAADLLAVSDVGLADGLVELLAAPASSPTPFTHARTLAGRLEALAKPAAAVTGSKPSASRMLAGLLLEVWAQRMRAALPAGSGPVVAAAGAGLAAVADARVALDRNVPARQVLTSVTVTVAR